MRRQTRTAAARALPIFLPILAAALTALAAPAARAQTAAPPSAEQKAEAPAPAPALAPATAPAPPPPPAITVPGASATPPADAEAALERARAAYEYGEMDMVVDSARLVAEGGRLHPTTAQRAQALRYLGIGLYLTDRHEGAETAFFDLLRLKPHTRLDATTTRPDVVAFFEDVRRRHAAEINEAASNRPGKSLALAFLPPFGQFQAGHKARGITIAALEVLSLGGAIATNLQLRSWDKMYPGHTFAPPEGEMGESHASDARILKSLNYVSVALFVTTVVVGVIDGVASYTAVEPEDTGTSVADVFLGGLRF